MAEVIRRQRPLAAWAWVVAVYGFVFTVAFCGADRLERWSFIPWWAQDPLFLAASQTIHRAVDQSLSLLILFPSLLIVGLAGALGVRPGEDAGPTPLSAWFGVVVFSIAIGGLAGTSLVSGVWTSFWPPVVASLLVFSRSGGERLKEGRRLVIDLGLVAALALLLTWYRQDTLAFSVGVLGTLGLTVRRPSLGLALICVELLSLLGWAMASGVGHGVERHGLHVPEAVDLEGTLHHGARKQVPPACLEVGTETLDARDLKPCRSYTHPQRYNSVDVLPATWTVLAPGAPLTGNLYFMPTLSSNGRAVRPMYTGRPKAEAMRLELLDSGDFQLLSQSRPPQILQKSELPGAFEDFDNIRLELVRTERLTVQDWVSICLSTAPDQSIDTSCKLVSAGTPFTSIKSDGSLRHQRNKLRHRRTLLQTPLRTP